MTGDQINQRYKARRIAMVISMFLLLCLPSAGYSTQEGIQDRENTREIKHWIAELKNKDPNQRSNAATALGNLGDARALDPLIVALKDEDPILS